MSDHPHPPQPDAGHEEFGQPPVRRPAPAEHAIDPLLGSRWSPRAIDPERPVPTSTLLRLMEAARWAPSSSNEQPWRYLVFDDAVAEAREQARRCLNPGNAWALAAPVLLLSVVQNHWVEAANKQGINRLALHDVGAASLSLALQGISEGLVVHQMAGFDLGRAREVFELPEACDPVAMIAVGFPGDVDDLPEKDRVREGRPRRRRALSRTFFAGAWGRGFAD